ncbi:MAG: hypothetical protein PHQ43_11270 [Dehalococcoidales bacterium]|nr:hypothetical protein [Dehalococcoidales bacterium]
MEVLKVHKGHKGLKVLKVPERKVLKALKVLKVRRLIWRGEMPQSTWLKLLTVFKVYHLAQRLQVLQEYSALAVVVMNMFVQRKTRPLQGFNAGYSSIKGL